MADENNLNKPAGVAKLTIAIPTYNRKDYLGECLESIFKQTFQDFQVIVFDNHSDYDVAEFLKRWPENKISLQKSEVNTGHLGNMIRIFNYKFKSEFITVFHDDNTMHPLLLERGVKVLQENPDVIYVGTGLRFGSSGADMWNFDTLDEKVKPLFCNKADLVRLLLNNFHLSFDTTLYRAPMLNDMSPFADNFSKWYDRPYLISMAEKGRAAILPERMENLRQHPGQSSNTESVRDTEKFFNLRTAFCSSLPQPLSREDYNLFQSWSTNNAVLSAANFAGGFRDYRRWINIFREKGFFKYKYLNFRGVLYFIKVLKKYVAA